MQLILLTTTSEPLLTAPAPAALEDLFPKVVTHVTPGEREALTLLSATTADGQERRFTFLHQSMRLPEAICAELAAYSFWLKDAAAILSRHAGHTILSSVGQHAWPVNVANAALLTAATIGLAEKPNVVGIVGAAGGLFAPADLARMRNIVRSGELPVQLWVQFAFRKTASGVTITTRGLAEFFDYEIEAWDVPRPLEDVSDLITGLIRHLWGAGPVIKDGDSFGRHANEKIRCRFGDSAEQRPRPVRALFLEFA